MSFLNKKYLDRWRQEIQEIFNLQYGATTKIKRLLREEENNNNKETNTTPLKRIQRNSRSFLTVQFPDAKQYKDYLALWKKKLPKRDDKAIRERMRKEIEEKKQAYEKRTAKI